MLHSVIDLSSTISPTIQNLYEIFKYIAFDYLQNGRHNAISVLLSTQKYNVRCSDSKVKYSSALYYIPS